jgi:hypothetical protein
MVFKVVGMKMAELRLADTETVFSAGRTLDLVLRTITSEQGPARAPETIRLEMVSVLNSIIPDFS